MARGKAGWVSGCWDVPAADAGARELSSRRASIISPSRLFFGRTWDGEPLSLLPIPAPAFYRGVACVGWFVLGASPRTRGAPTTPGGRCVAGSAACPEATGSVGTVMASGAQAGSQTYI